MLVASGKGGVGKSTVAVSLARGLAGAGHRVGLIDADIHAPDIPLMLGLSRPQRARSLTINAVPGTPGSKLEPLRWNDLQVASAGFLVGDAQALALGGGLAEALLTRLIWSTNWDEVSCLVLDLPPGTGVLTQYATALPGALTLLVVTPEQVAHLDTGRLVDLITRGSGGGRATVDGATVGGIVGGVENMAYYPCPHCGTHGPIYPPADAAATIWTRVTKLAAIPVLATADPVERLDALAAAVAPATEAVAARLA